MRTRGHARSSLLPPRRADARRPAGVENAAGRIGYVQNVKQRDGQGRTAFRAATDGTDSAMVIMRGDLDAQARRDFDREVSQLLAASPRRVVVDMGEVTCLDSTWLEVLTQLRTRLGREGQATLQFSAASAAAREMLALGGFSANAFASAPPVPTESPEPPQPSPTDAKALAAETGLLTARLVRRRASPAVTVPVAAALAESPSSKSPSTARGRFVWPRLPPRSEPRRGPVHLSKVWFARRTDLQKLSLVGLAGAFLVALLIFGFPNGPELSGYSAPSRAEDECATRYVQQGPAGAASDRDTFIRNCVAAGQAMLADQVAPSASTAPRDSLTNRIAEPIAEVGATAETITSPTSVAARPPSPPARRSTRSTSVPAATTTHQVTTTAAPTSTVAVTTTTANVTTTTMSPTPTPGPTPDQPTTSGHGKGHKKKAGRAPDQSGIVPG